MARRIFASVSRSAIVTGVWSGLSSTTIEERKYCIGMAAATWLISSAAFNNSSEDGSGMGR